MESIPEPNPYNRNVVLAIILLYAQVDPLGQNPRVINLKRYGIQISVPKSWKVVVADPAIEFREVHFVGVQGTKPDARRPVDTDILLALGDGRPERQATLTWLAEPRPYLLNPREFRPEAFHPFELKRVRFGVLDGFESYIAIGVNSFETRSFDYEFKLKGPSYWRFRGEVTQQIGEPSVFDDYIPLFRSMLQSVAQAKG